MSMSLDRPAGVYGEPGPDVQPQDIDQLVDQVIAVISADRVIDDREQRAIQRLLAVMQQIAEQKAAAAMPSSGGMPGQEETSDFGATEGTEPAEGSTPLPGQSWAGA